MSSANTSATQNLIITGLMGSGKTTVGKLAAEKLQRKFVDTDEFIEKHHGPTSAIFAHADGDERFRQLEQSVANDLASSRQLVIATGGRFFLNQTNIDAMKSSGCIVCLFAELSELVERLQTSNTNTFRPRFANAQDKLQLMSMLSEQSEPFLSQFDSISTMGCSPPNVALKVCEYFNATERF